MPGEGSVYRRNSDGRWVAALSEGPRGDRVIRRRYARSKAEARAELEAMLRSLDPTTQTVGAYLEQWVTEARGIRPTTRHAYRAAIAEHLAPAIGHIRLAELTPMHVEQVLVQVEGRRSPKTARNVHGTLRRALGQAVRGGLIGKNVAAREFVDAPRVPVEEPRALTEAEVDRLLAAARGDRLEALFILAVDTGLRQGELLGLAWQHIEPPMLRVRQELIYTKGVKRGAGTYRPGELKTPRSRRDVPLTARAAAALEAHRAAMTAEGFVPIATGPVFVSPAGRAVSGSWLTHHFYDLLAAAGIERIPFKNLRTTFASRLDRAGVPELTIATLMGHTRTHTTRKHYISQAPEANVAAIARLA